MIAFEGGGGRSRRIDRDGEPVLWGNSELPQTRAPWELKLTQPLQGRQKITADSDNDFAEPSGVGCGVAGSSLICSYLPS
jgi:hypothetical protein